MGPPSVGCWGVTLVRDTWQCRAFRGVQATPPRPSATTRWQPGGLRAMAASRRRRWRASLLAGRQMMWNFQQLVQHTARGPESGPPGISIWPAKPLRPTDTVQHKYSELVQPFCLGATRSIIIKINKTQNNCCYSTFLCRTSNKLMLISLV